MTRFVCSPLVVWIGFAAWACFYAAGGRLPGLGKALAANVSGLLWGAALLWAANQLAAGSAVVLGLFVALAAFGMCLQAAVPVLDGDTPDSLSARILIEEHRIYSEAIRIVLAGAYRIEGRRVLHGKALGS